MTDVIAQACMPDAVINIGFTIKNRGSIERFCKTGTHIFKLSIAGSSLQALSQLAFNSQAPILATVSNITSEHFVVISSNRNRNYSNIISCLACKAF